MHESLLKKNCQELKDTGMNQFLAQLPNISDENRPSSYVEYNSNEFNSHYIRRLVDIKCFPIQRTNLMEQDAVKTFFIRL